jgi:phosphoglycolate phosphatase
MATYIFDFDGTIADSFSLACRILRNHAHDLGCNQLTLTELSQLKEMHAREVLKYLGVPFWRIPSFVRKIRSITYEHVDEVHVFPEWMTVLKTLSCNQHQIGLISSNSRNTVEFVLRKHQLFDLFNFIFCDKSLFGKNRCLSKLIRKKNIIRSSAYYIGDEVRDIEAAHAAQIQSIAVGWGFNSISRLKQATPGQLVIDMEQLAQVLCVRAH